MFSGYAELQTYNRIMAGKIQIPETLKAELPPNKWGKILGATPIVMTVLATMLAGLASSEMTKAQYDRALAAQLQSKAGDQWGYFQAKKLRSALAHNSLELLQATTGVRFMESEDLQKQNPVVFRALFAGQLPDPKLPQFDNSVTAALATLTGSQSETEILGVLANTSNRALAEALIAARQRVMDFDAAIKPVSQSLDALENTATSSGGEKLRSFNATRFRFQAACYDAESRLNQTIANIYELQVRKGNVSAEKHHARSGKFFFGMLAAQMAVIISTFAIAARQKNLLWSVAAIAGVAAVSFSLYVYLCV